MSEEGLEGKNVAYVDRAARGDVVARGGGGDGRAVGGLDNQDIRDVYRVGFGQEAPGRNFEFGRF